MKPGSLTIVGSGIQLGSHLTLSAESWIRAAEKVLFAVADPLTSQWLQSLNPSAEPLPYGTTALRRETYSQIVEVILNEVRQGHTVCAVFYGHPGVFADAPHNAIRQARAEGFFAQMLPGISAEACLFADLGLDPGRLGYQSYEATDFLIRPRRFDPHSALVLWQISMIANPGFYEPGRPSPGLALLTEVLTAAYGPDHEAILYEAALYPTTLPQIIPIRLAALGDSAVSEVATLYVPPLAPAPLDETRLTQLGLRPLAPEVMP